MWIPLHREQLRAERAGRIAGRRSAVGERVEVTRAVEGEFQRPLRIPQRLADIPLGVGHEPGVFVVAIGVVGDRLDLLVDLFQRPCHPRCRIDSVRGIVVAEPIPSDQGIDIFRMRGERLLESAAIRCPIAVAQRIAGHEVKHPRPQRRRVAPQLHQNLIGVCAAAVVEHHAEHRCGLPVAAVVMEELGPDDTRRREVVEG